MGLSGALRMLNLTSVGWAPAWPVWPFTVVAGTSGYANRMTRNQRSAPLVSIVMPTFARPDYLSRAIRSVLAQTVDAWVLQVVDDNAPDSPERAQTKRVMSEFAGEERVHHVLQPRNLGACAARNTGAGAGDSKYIAFLDDDDEWLPDKLELQLAVMEAADDSVAVSYTGFRMVYGGRFPDVDVTTGQEGWIARSLLHRNYIGTTSTIMVRRDAFEAVGGFDVDFPASQDYDLYLRLSETYAFARVPKVLTLSHRHGTGSISQDLGAKKRALELLLERHGERFAREPDAIVDQLRRMAEILIHRERAGEARSLLARAMRLRPWNAGLRSLWLTSWVPVRMVRKAAALTRGVRRGDGGAVVP